MPSTVQHGFPAADSDYNKNNTVYYLQLLKSQKSPLKCRLIAHPPTEMRRQKGLVAERDRRLGGNSEVELREEQLVVEQTHQR